ncbi:BrnA antitoxin family protein [Neorhizobium sp. NCHU2750]|uniref:BrnA antitoxin family protein n=1 Tax=Neorhizobium sp. NCHU2750 TaxID=1825976 RepID=UPI0032D9CB97
MVRYRIDPSNVPPLTEKQKAELNALSQMRDDQIDYSDIAPSTDQQLASAQRGQLYRPVKQQITARVDADVLEWLKSQGKGYQARINAILRREMLASLKPHKKA